MSRQRQPTTTASGCDVSELSYATRSSLCTTRRGCLLLWSMARDVADRRSQISAWSWLIECDSERTYASGPVIRGDKRIERSRRIRTLSQRIQGEGRTGKDEASRTGRGSSREGLRTIERDTTIEWKDCTMRMYGSISLSMRTVKHSEMDYTLKAKCASRQQRENINTHICSRLEGHFS